MTRANCSVLGLTHRAEQVPRVLVKTLTSEEFSHLTSHIYFIGKDGREQKLYNCYVITTPRIHYQKNEMTSCMWVLSDLETPFLEMVKCNKHKGYTHTRYL